MLMCYAEGYKKKFHICAMFLEQTYVAAFDKWHIYICLPLRRTN